MNTIIVNLKTESRCHTPIQLKDAKQSEPVNNVIENVIYWLDEKHTRSNIRPLTILTHETTKHHANAESGLKSSNNEDKTTAKVTTTEN